MVKRECFWCYRRRPMRTMTAVPVSDPVYEWQVQCKNMGACTRALHRMWTRMRRRRASQVVGRFGRHAMSCWQDLVVLHSTAVTS